MKSWILKMFTKYRAAKTGNVWHVEYRNLGTAFKWVRHGGSKFYSKQEYCIWAIERLCKQWVIPRVEHKYETKRG